MWNKRKQLAELREEKDRLKESVEDLTTEVSRLKSNKKIEEEEIKHMIKISNEKKEIELEKEKMKLQKECADKIARVKDDYRDKIESQLKNEGLRISTTMKEIMDRLPNYNINHKVVESK